MSRFFFKQGDQRKFMKAVKTKLGRPWEEIALKVGVSGRTLRDWQREILLGKKEILSKLSRLSGISLPLVLEEREEWWNARAWSARANVIRMKMYGPPGTPEGRSKGGRISQLRRRINPNLYKDSGIIFRNTFNYPAESQEFAEFIGIMLGDGGMSSGQIKITLDMNVDKKYASIVQNMINNLFKRNPSLYIRKDVNVITICLTGVNLVNYLVSKGLCIGSKMRANIGIPKWIKSNPSYSKSCIRGLVDTDGCFFIHKYKVNNKIYEYKKINFVSYIPQLMSDVENQLKSFGFTPKVRGVRLFLYNQHEALRYLKEIGTSNPKNYFRWRLSEH